MTPDGAARDPDAVDLGRPRLLAGATAALGLAWRAAPAGVAGYVLLSVVAAAAPVGTAWLTKLLIDRLTAADVAAATVVWLAVGAAAAGIAAAALPHITGFVRSEVDRALGLVTADRLFGAVARFVGLARFESPAFLDRLRLAEQSARETSRQVVDGVFASGQGLLMISGFVVSLMVLSPLITVVVLIAAGPALAAQLALDRRRARLAWAMSPTQRREMFYAQLLSTVEAAKEIRLFAAGGFLRRRMLDERRRANAAHRAMDGSEARVQSVLAITGGVLAGAGLVWVGLRVHAGQLTVGDIALYMAAVAGVQGGLTSAVSALSSAHHGVLLFHHFQTVVDAPPDLPVPADPRPLPPLRRGIELRDVWFRYSADHPWALRGVTLTIHHGQAVGLVGRNGAGKSTLVKLLCRLYDPTRGTILWDGVDLRDVDPQDLRQRISAVFQDYMCYDLPVSENIALGDLDALDDPARLRAAAQLAGAHETLAALPRGYDTLLSRIFFGEADKDDPDTGVILSGGQWQRLALARGFVRTASDLMILDEPSAGLDAEAEQRIHANMRRHRVGRTSLLISHRLGAVREADDIVVLDGGRVVEQGAHQALLAADGVYARLFRLQAEGYRDGEASAAHPLRGTADAVSDGASSVR